MAANIEVIGAGSATFSLDILRDLSTTPGLHGADIKLIDINEERLAVIEKVASSYNSEFNAGYNFSIDTSWINSLSPDTDFVILAALEGGRDTMDRDRSLLEEHGYYRGIGINTPFRQLKLMMEVGEHMAAVCPDATLIMAANPVPEGCGLVQQATNIDTIGICHGHREIEKMYGVLGVTDYGLVESVVAGMNHNIWLTRFSYKGEDAYPMFDKWVHGASNSFYDYYTPFSHHADYQLSRVTLDMYKRYGLIPVGDTSRGIMPEFWWYTDSPETKEKYFGPSQGFDGDIGHKRNITWLNNIVNVIDKFSEGQSASRAFGVDRSQWDIVPYMDARVNNAPTKLQLSFENRGAITGLDSQTFVEAPVVVDSNGINRMDAIQFPDLVLQGALIPRELLARRIISAIKHKDERFIMQTWLADFKTKSLNQAESAWEALIEAEWNRDMNGYYRDN